MNDGKDRDESLRPKVTWDLISNSNEIIILFIVFRLDYECCAWKNCTLERLEFKIGWIWARNRSASKGIQDTWCRDQRCCRKATGWRSDWKSHAGMEILLEERLTRKRSRLGAFPEICAASIVRILSIIRAVSVARSPSCGFHHADSIVPLCGFYRADSIVRVRLW